MQSKERDSLISALQRSLPNISIMRRDFSFAEVNSRGEIVSDTYSPETPLGWAKFLEVLESRGFSLTYANKPGGNKS